MVKFSVYLHGLFFVMLIKLNPGKVTITQHSHPETPKEKNGCETTMHNGSYIQRIATEEPSSNGRQKILSILQEVCLSGRTGCGCAEEGRLKLVFHQNLALSSEP